MGRPAPRPGLGLGPPPANTTVYIPPSNPNTNTNPTTTSPKASSTHDSSSTSGIKDAGAGWLDAHVTRCMDCLDCVVPYCQPALVLLAVGLILLDVYTYLVYVVPQVIFQHGYWVAGGEGAVSAWLLFNVFWNQAHCTLTSPGTTAEVHEHALQLAATPEWRWCRACRRAKPPLTHHCSICNKCVLKMDHHCVWMANCVGFFNYRYFLLFLFYMWVGSAYSAAIFLAHVPWLFRLDDPAWDARGFLPFFMFIMSSSICVGLSAMFGWHVWLVLTGQGTIDYLDNAARAEVARREGRPRWVNRYHLGPGANWRETFDVHGRWWWAAWALPTRRRKLGNGFVLPVNETLLAHETSPLLRGGGGAASSYV